MSIKGTQDTWEVHKEWQNKNRNTSSENTLSLTQPQCSTFLNVLVSAMERGRYDRILWRLIFPF